MDLVEGAEQVERVFGYWPSFHDAEVLDITLSRESCGAVRGPTVHFSVHAFEMTDEVDARGYFVLRKHVLVTFALYSVEVLQLDGFNLQSVLFGLHFSRPAEPVEPDLTVQVDLESSYGVAARFQCSRAEVVSVEPHEPRGRAA